MSGGDTGSEPQQGEVRAVPGGVNPEARRTGARVAEFLAAQRWELRVWLRWMVPALLMGAVLRGLMLWMMPHVYWGSDSLSFFRFAYDLMHHGEWEFDEKRRWVYPVVMLVLYVLPGATLKWIALFQHFYGWLSLLPLGFLLMAWFPKTWRISLIPVTVLYAAAPAILALEHQMIGDSFVVSTLLWCAAGWTLWQKDLYFRRGAVQEVAALHATGATVQECRDTKSARASVKSGKGPELQREMRGASAMWWLFFVPVAVLLLTKPAMKFMLPALVLGLLYLRVWRSWNWLQALSLPLVVALSLTIATERQGAFRIYFSLFPFTDVESGKHAELKAEARDLILNYRENLDTYYALMMQGSSYKDFVRLLQRDKARPAWAALNEKGNEAEMSRTYKELALEAVLNEPVPWLYTSGTRILAAANTGLGCDVSVLGGDYYAERFGEMYQRQQGDKPELVRKIIGLEKGAPFPPYSELRVQMWGGVQSEPGRTVWRKLSRLYGGPLALVGPENGAVRGVPGSQFYLMPLGWLMVLGTVCCVWLSHTRANAGVWLVLAWSYLVIVFLIGTVAARYFAPALPFLVLALGAVPEAAATLFRRCKS